MPLFILQCSFLSGTLSFVGSRVALHSSGEVLLLSRSFSELGLEIVNEIHFLGLNNFKVALFAVCSYYTTEQ